MSIWDSMMRVISAVAQNGAESVMAVLSALGASDGPSESDDDPRRLKSLSQQVAFTIGVIGLGAKMAKADGMVTPDEIDAFREVFHIPPGEERNVQRVFNLARQDVAGYETYARQIARLFRGKPGALEDLLDGLFHIAKADGVVHEKEVAFLARVAEIFGFAPNEFERIRCSHVGCPDADSYGILGVEPDISDENLRKAYLRLVREHHPDAYVARGVPEEFVGMATAKLAIINTAYERIKAQRGLT